MIGHAPGQLNGDADRRPQAADVDRGPRGAEATHRRVREEPRRGQEVAGAGRRRGDLAARLRDRSGDRRAPRLDGRDARPAEGVDVASRGMRNMGVAALEGSRALERPAIRPGRRRQQRARQRPILSRVDTTVSSGKTYKHNRESIRFPFISSQFLFHQGVAETYFLGLGAVELSPFRVGTRESADAPQGSLRGVGDNVAVSGLDRSRWRSGGREGR